MTILTENGQWAETPNGLKETIKQDIDQILGYYQQIERLSLFIKEDIERPALREKVIVS